MWGWGGEVLSVQVIKKEKNKTFQPNQWFNLVKPHHGRLGSPSVLWILQEGRDNRMSFSHSSILKVSGLSGLAFLLGLLITLYPFAKGTGLVSAFPNRRFDMFLRIKRLWEAETNVWGMGNEERKHGRKEMLLHLNHPHPSHLDEGWGGGMRKGWGRVALARGLDQTFWKTHLRCVFPFRKQIFKGENRYLAGGGWWFMPGFSFQAFASLYISRAWAPFASCTSVSRDIYKKP